jgi:hypothetical protein
MKGKEPRFEQGHGGKSLSPLPFPQKVIEAPEGIVRGRESQKSSTFVNYSERLSGRCFLLILKGKSVIWYAATGEEPQGDSSLFSLYL